MTKKHLVALGFGYVAQRFAKNLGRDDWQITGTTREVSLNDETVIWPGTDLSDALADATHILSSVPPGKNGDPVADLLRGNLDRMPRLEWLGLLSTTGVYGDLGGAWVNEDTPQVANSHRGGLRAAQASDWLAMHHSDGLPVHLFHLAGIYGPGRSPFDKLRNGTARRIVKPGQVFSRIHVDDIVQVLLASLKQPNPGRAYNLADDMPGPPQDVIETAARMIQMPVPPDIPFETADLSPMARSFYADNKRTSNARIKEELGVKLLFPDYHAGLQAILDSEVYHRCK